MSLGLHRVRPRCNPDGSRIAARARWEHATATGASDLLFYIARSVENVGAQEWSHVRGP